MGSCPVHCKIFNSIPGLCSLEFLPSPVLTPKMSVDIALMGHNHSGPCHMVCFAHEFPVHSVPILHSSILALECSALPWFPSHMTCLPQSAHCILFLLSTILVLTTFKTCLLFFIPSTWKSKILKNTVCMLYIYLSLFKYWFAKGQSWALTKYSFKAEWFLTRLLTRLDLLRKQILFHDLEV